MLLCFDVCEQSVSRTDSVSVVNDSVNYLGLKFTFKGETWTNLDKRVLFYSKGDDAYCEPLDNNNEVIVPFEVLTNDYFFFSLYGLGDDLRVTTNKMRIYLQDSGFTGDGVAPSGDHRTIVKKICDRIDTVAGDVSTLDIGLKAVSSLVDKVESDVSGLSTDVNALDGNVSRLSNSVSGLTGDVSALDNAVDSLSDTVSGHTTSIGGLTDDLSALDGTVDGLSDTVSDLNGTVSGHTSSISDLADTVSGHTSSINSLSDTVGGHTTSIGTIENDITSINGKLTNTIEMTVTFTDETTATYQVVVREDESN